MNDETLLSDPSRPGRLRRRLHRAHVATHDPVVESDALQLQSKFNAFFDDLQCTAGTPEGAYERYAAQSAVRMVVTGASQSPGDLTTPEHVRHEIVFRATQQAVSCYRIRLMSAGPAAQPKTQCEVFDRNLAAAAQGKWIRHVVRTCVAKYRAFRVEARHRLEQRDGCRYYWEVCTTATTITVVPVTKIVIDTVSPLPFCGLSFDCPKKILEHRARGRFF